MLYTLPCQGQCGNLSSASLLLLSFTCITYLVCYPSIEDVLRDAVHEGCCYKYADDEVLDW